MRDYIYEDQSGRQMPVEKMRTAEIHDVLRTGFHTDDNTPAPAIIERLQLELFIREKGLRI
jgi:hypothetical protein